MKNPVLTLGILLLLFAAPADALSLDDFSLNLSFRIPKSKNNISDIYVSKGHRMNAVEGLLYDALLSDQFMGLAYDVTTGRKRKDMDKVYVGDDPNLIPEAENKSLFIIVVGSENRNRITRIFTEKGYINYSEVQNIFRISHGQIPNSTRFAIIEHQSRLNPQRKAVETSPLLKYMDAAYVPIAATGIGVLLTALFQVIKTAAEFKALDYGRAKRRLYKNHYKILGVSPVEMAAVLGACMALGTGITWTVQGTSIDLYTWLRNIVICLGAALSHEVSHRIMGKFFGIHIEYHFWGTGSFITLLTGYLGNTFGIQGFLMSDFKGEVAQWKKGLTALAAPAFSTFLMAFFAYKHYQTPNELYQTIYMTASLWAMAEMLPFKPLDGAEVREWNSLIWKISFTIISLIFITVQFIG